MKALRLVVAILAFVPCLAFADTVTITDGNSNLAYTIDNPTYFLGGPSDPVQLPRKLEWTVESHRILVYPSGPSTLLDIGHLHPDAHVSASQLHAQGPLLGYATGATLTMITELRLEPNQPGRPTGLVVTPGTLGQP